MYKYFICVICNLFIIFDLFCQDVKLIPDGINIKIIGTRYSVNYTTGQQSETENAKANAFDGDYSTIFASYDRSYTWLGLDLGQTYIITSVELCPRQGYASRALLGVFEGSNSPDFIDAVPLALVRETPAENTMTKLEVDNSRGFRYVRYVGPNDVRCNIAEIAFFGHQGEGDDSRLTQTTNIPDVIIHTENTEEVTSRDYYISGVISFISNDGQEIYTDSLEIRGRGNASWNFPKKPYRLKLANAASPLGCPARARNWTLINNYGDKTLIRNLIAFDFSRRLEMPYTPAGRLVNVYFNGEYKGCYQFCDHIDIRPGRVDIEEIKQDEPFSDDFAGGYLVEIDAYASSEQLYFYSAKNTPVTIKQPDFEAMSNKNDPRRKYIETFFNTAEASVYNANADYWRNLIDPNTFVRHFLVGEISGNTDTYWSVYMSKQRGENIFRVGPVWDFDIAFENDRRTTPINGKTNWLCLSSGSFAGNSREMFSRMITSATSDIRSVWRTARASNAICWDTISKVIDDYETEIDESQKLNFTRWNILSQRVHENYQALGSYSAELNVIRWYLKDRISWIDNKLGYTVIDSAADDGITIASADGYISVNGISRQSRIDLFDLTGRAVRSENAMNDISIPTAGLAAGIYIVRVESIGKAGSARRSEKITVK